MSANALDIFSKFFNSKENTLMYANLSIINPTKNFTSFKRQVIYDKRLISYLMMDLNRSCQRETV